MSVKVHVIVYMGSNSVICNSGDVKISNVNTCTSNMPVFFIEKMREAFTVQKLLSFFQQKTSVYLVKKW